MENPRLFGFMDDNPDSYLIKLRGYIGDYTQDIIFYLGIINLVCSSAIVFFFLVQRAPLIFTHHWYTFPPANKGLCFCILIYTFVKLCIKSLLECFYNFQFWLHAEYLIVSILGLFNPFAYSIHLLISCLQVKLMQNVVKAVWDPRI